MLEIRCSDCKGNNVMVNAWLQINKLPTKIVNIANISSLLNSKEDCFCHDCGHNVNVDTVCLEDEKRYQDLAPITLR